MLVKCVQVVHDLTLSNQRVKLVKYIQVVHDLTLSSGINLLNAPLTSHIRLGYGYWMCRAGPGSFTP